MIYLLYFIHVVVCLFLILVVLLQQGKGADLSVFGGGATQAAFGARGAATLLHKMTVGAFVAFIVTTMAIGFLQGTGGTASVMEELAEEATAAPETSAPEPDPPALPFEASQGAGPAGGTGEEAEAAPPAAAPEAETGTDVP